MSGNILAFDCGTTGVKAVLIDYEGHVICYYKDEYPLIQPEPGWAEQDTAILWQSMCNAARGVVEKAGIQGNEIIGLAFAAPWKNIIPIDKDKNVLRNSIIWMDGRANEQAKRLNENMGEFIGTGQEYWPRLMWVKENEPEIWNNAEYIIGLNTFFKWKATGNIATEPSDDFIHSFDPQLQKRYDKILKAAGLLEDLNKFPPLKLATDRIGGLTSEAADEMGLAKGIPVFGGFGDLVAITIGTGCCKENSSHIYLGTSGWFANLVKSRNTLDPGLWFSFDPYLEGGIWAVQTGCMAFDWAVNQFYNAERKELGDDGAFAFVNSEIKEIPAGCDGLIATHWLNGELPPLGAKNVKAVFLNINSNHNRKHFLKAVMESLCYSHRLGLEQYEKQSGKKVKSIRVVGGGATSDVWCQALADILNIPVEVPEDPRYTGAIGVYYCVMVGLGVLKDYDEIYDAVNIQKTFKPNEGNNTIYNKLYNVYIKLFPTLEKVYNEINGNF